MILVVSIFLKNFCGIGNLLAIQSPHFAARYWLQDALQAHKEWQQKKPGLFVKRVYEQTRLVRYPIH